LFVASIAAATQLTMGLATGLYRGRRTIASFEEVRLVVLSTMIAATAAFTVVAATSPPSLVPQSAVLAAGAYQLVGALGVRYLIRATIEWRLRSHHERPHRTLVFGAGEAGEQIVTALERDTTTDLDPVALLDDDPTKRRLRIGGLTVTGNRRDIATVAAKFHADTLLIAVPTAAQAEVNAIADAGHEAGLTVKTLPPVHEMVASEIQVTDIHDIRMRDFLNRDEVSIDDAAVRSYLTNKRVLVTGAGGSIGSELCRAVLRYDPERLMMLDHDENALHALQLSIEGRALLDSQDLALCDIRDESAVEALFREFQPDVVFHAAAHKHVTFLERFPDEAMKTNVLGTLNLLETARLTGVKRFVNVSTDKAADPKNVLGMTKRLAEMMTADRDRLVDGAYMSVRFGNVLGSNGSVIPTLASQITAGSPVTVTHPEVTRYFMTIEEAVLLVLQAGAVGKGGDVLVLDMGEPVRIVDLARRLNHVLNPSSRPLDVVYTGLRPGEKLHEVLSASDDEPLEHPHSRLQRFRVPRFAPDELLLVPMDRAALTDWLAKVTSPTTADWHSTSAASASMLHDGVRDRT
jgi:FlaA1/EpsC-like NDP-sugar epimerase